MRRLDRYAIEKIGIPEAVLMESAGRSVFADIRRQEGKLADRSVAVFCGNGNNGGDGFVIARYLSMAGARVEIFLLGGRPKKDPALQNLKILEKMEVYPVEIRNATELAKNLRSRSWEIVVDSLFGTGLKRPLTGVFAAAVEGINRSRAAVYAVDIPSGLDADSGEILGTAVQAKCTVTFACKKRGFFFREGPVVSGEVIVADISIDEKWCDDVRAARLFETDPRSILSLFPPRRLDSHKGTYGHVLVIAGSKEKSGASVLTSQAALRAGAGLVTLAVPESAHAIVKSQLVEVMTEPLTDTDGKLSDKNLPRLLELAQGKQSVVIGPGLIPHPGLYDLLRKFLAQLKIPVVLDADGLNVFGKKLAAERKSLQKAILTPHPGEMARISGKTNKEIQSDRIGVAREMSDRTGAVVVLKGAHSVIALPNGDTYLNPTGNPAMATAGMGDVLAGVAGGYLGQGLSIVNAAVAAVFHHGMAGDRAVIKKGTRGLLARDVIDEFPSLSLSL